MSSLTMLEKRKLEEILGSASGYVLDYTNSTFAELFRTTVKIDIYATKYAAYGDSKGKRLRAFLEQESDTLVGKVLSEMLQLWRHIQVNSDKSPDTQQFKDCVAIIARLSGKPPIAEDNEDSFLKKQFNMVPFNNLALEPTVIPLLEARLKEALDCRQAGACLSSIIMCGSILEGLLLGAASKEPAKFNQSNACPKRDGKPKPFHEWSLAEFIDVAHEVGLLSLDVKKFGHVLRDFRNYVHPYSQMATQFSPNEHTADICLQVLKASIASLSGSKPTTEGRP